MDRLKNLATRARRALPTYIARPELALDRLRAMRRPSTVTFRKVEYFGMSLVVMANEDIGWQIASGAGFEKAELTALGGLLRPDDVCLDVGGNIGIYATYFGQRVPQGRVMSFEPIPLNAGLIEVNTALNHCDNVVVERCALADFEGVSEFAVGNDAAYSSLLSTGRVADSEIREVRVTTLDSWLSAAHVRATVLKIDVEGAELAVLRGAKEFLNDVDRRPRLVMVEVNQRNQAVYKTEPREVVAFLRDLGYEVYSILESGTVMPDWPNPGAVEDVLFMSPAASSVP
jgi:FkbM family methyltransferase